MLLIFSSSETQCSIGQPAKGKVTPPQTLSTAVLSIYPVSLLVLGAVIFLALVLLVVLFYQNRVLRRVLSKRRRKTLTEAVYEEIANPIALAYLCCDCTTFTGLDQNAEPTQN
ncbi:hypothetical protein MHYP_G00319270 [Metynnis hypsauchen]